MTKGFTLIELLVVVLIIGILAAIALPQYQFAVDKSRYTQLMTFGNAIEKASQVYYMENGTYPRRFDELSVDLPGTGDGYRKVYQDYACELTNTTMDQSDGIYCSIIRNTNRLSYRLVFGYGWRCMATKTWKQGNKVCQNLTGKKTPTGSYGDVGAANEQAVYRFD